MGKWYNEAVFYHMYPLGMTGAPKENKEPETVHRLRELFPVDRPFKGDRSYSDLYRTAV